MVPAETGTNVVRAAAIALSMLTACAAPTPTSDADADGPPAAATAQPARREPEREFPVQGRPGPVAAGQLDGMIRGRTVRLGTGVAEYGADGSYSYNGGSPGRYRVRDGRICVDFESGNARCDQVVLEDGRYYFVDREGRRYRFRPG